jgi:hypothetical protein
MVEFKEADEEFMEIADELFEKHQDTLKLTVEPKDIMFLRSDSSKKAYAYCKRVTDEYTLLTDKKFFIVIVNKYFDYLKTDAEKRYVILHEMMHLFVTENGKYKLLDHNLKEFRQLLQNPEWNLLLVGDGKGEAEDTDGKVKIGLDFDFHNKEALKEFKKKVKEEQSGSKSEDGESNEDEPSEEELKNIVIADKSYEAEQRQAENK